MFLCLGLLLSGCTGPRPLKGGQAMTSRNPNGDWQLRLVQGENSSQASRQEQETVRERSYVVPAGTVVMPGRGQKPEDRGQRAEGGIPDYQLSTLNYPPSANSQLLLAEREETHTRTELGAAQKDTARELGARLASLKGIVWVGAGLFVFGLASLVWPPLRAVVTSVTTSAGCMLGGVALMVLPNLIAGHELLLLSIVGLAVGAWFLAHRHGQLRGEVSSLKAKV